MHLTLFKEIKLLISFCKSNTRFRSEIVWSRDVDNARADRGGNSAERSKISPLELCSANILLEILFIYEQEYAINIIDILVPNNHNT